MTGGGCRLTRSGVLEPSLWKHSPNWAIRGLITVSHPGKERASEGERGQRRAADSRGTAADCLISCGAPETAGSGAGGWMELLSAALD